MGLGKTLQTISFLAYLRERNVWGPFLVIAPMSTLANWVSEFNRFTPTIPVVLYHGSIEERAHIRRKRMSKLGETFPVVVTSYELIMNDRKFLQKYAWKYLVIDEGHRIKNMNCKLVRELKSYHSANRLLLTGTPLQNNLLELWSLLNFLLPDIFDSVEIFQSWFDFNDLNEQKGKDKVISDESQHNIISKLHHILKPFLLRRLKLDVEFQLPKKREYVLYAPMTAKQKEYYDATLNGQIHEFLKKRLGIVEGKAESDGDDMDANRSRRRSATKNTNYAEISDEEFFDQNESIEEFEDSEAMPVPMPMTKDTPNQKVFKHMKLQTIMMQLCKICNHPYLFDGPYDDKTGYLNVTEEVQSSSGKMILLNQLLTTLIGRGHRILIFSQMTKMLDIIEDWLMILKGWKCCRIDGSIHQEERREQIHEFNTDHSIEIFLLSTRAGGLGINLTAADTVILFDNDWNPQMDLQAQDRVHRIGQTKPVIVYRFVTSNSVEAQILERANSKRTLEKLVIHKRQFKGNNGKASTRINIEDLMEILENADENAKIIHNGDSVLSLDEMEKILDRTPEAYERSTTLDVGNAFKQVITVADEQNDALSSM
ncbi:putative ATPase [Basidiobolus ranarum]|uniref:ATPase n=1 Tax=Basidiobolus ranarum TaxID=34480 RepID=A0ABR2WS11_9FUNG